MIYPISFTFGKGSGNHSDRYRVLEGDWLSLQVHRLFWDRPTHHVPAGDISLANGTFTFKASPHQQTKRTRWIIYSTIIHQMPWTLKHCLVACDPMYEVCCVSSPWDPSSPSHEEPAGFISAPRKDCGSADRIAFGPRICFCRSQGGLHCTFADLWPRLWTA